MDAIQFGRWLSERRRLHGWNSQRAFVETARQHPFLKEQNISEDFLARLEAGQFVHPFRGSVRQRVLAMASLLCKTSREVRTYLRAAELTELNDEETKILNRLSDYLLTLRNPNPAALLPLPPRPMRLFGRAALVEELVSTLSTLEMGLCALTGMPGVGKSALAYEVVHRLASNERQHLRAFPDGIATFTCTGRRGLTGLMALLVEIAEIFPPPAPSSSRLKQSITGPAASGFTQVSPGLSDGKLAEAIDRVRLTLANKRLLLLLDDVDAQFPLRQLLEALFAQDQNSTRDQEGTNIELARRVVFTTSHYIPAPALQAAHFRVGPLEPEAAFDLLIALIGRHLHSEELADGQRLCAAVGYLPLAIEVAATAIKTKGIPLSLLAARVAQHPLDRLLDGEQELSSKLEQALEHLDPEMQQRFVLLSTLGVQSFGLESATAIRSTTPGRLRLPEHAGTADGNGASVAVVESAAERSLTQFANTAADLGQFVRYSLLELVPDQERSSLLAPEQLSQSAGIRYQLHPLLYAHALDRLGQLEPEVVEAAERNVQVYAQAYIEHYQGDILHLEREREFLLTALAQAWQQDQYQQVVFFVLKLKHVIGRDGNYEEGERVLRWGIHASQHLHDRYHLACFMNRLAGLYLYRGELDQAQQTWERCLEIADELGSDRPAHLWFPLANLAIVAELHGDYDNARHLAETYLRHAQEAADSSIIAHGFFTRGAYARLQGDRDRAYLDLSTSVQLLTVHDSDHPCIENRLLTVMAQAELARVQKDYARSQEYTDAMLSLLEITSDLYNIPEALFEQARFAHQEGMLDDARKLARRTVRLAEQIRAPHLRKRGIDLLKKLPHASLS